MGALRGRPSLAAAVTVLLACLPAGGADAPAGVDVTASDVASVLLVAIAAVVLFTTSRALSPGLGRGTGGWAGRGVLPVRAVVLAPVAGAAALALLASPDTLVSLPGFVRFLQVFVLVPLAVLVTVRDRADVMIVGGALVGAATLQGVIGCVQVLTGTGAAYGGERVRAVGTFGAPDVMAMATMVSYGIVILLGAGLTQRGRARVLTLAGAGLLCVPLALSLSRGCWIAVLGAALVVVFLRSRVLAARVVLVVAAAAVLAFATGTGSDLMDRRLASIASAVSDPDQSVSDRYSLWLAATRMWAEHPATGVGPRRFGELRDTYAPIELSSGSDTDDPVHGYQRRPLLSPHNMYLLTLSEQGLFGLGAFVAFLGSLTWWALRGGVLVAAGLLTCQTISFAYGDIGGPSTTVMSVALGLALALVAGRRETTAPVEAATPVGAAR
ncbi:O-antigen ligase domain-containing protein [Nonomuraea terrae]|uniref:O-antigen ligase domain-containing protein n=1 Tax=Nonomuraea terrae TaxID=2530383 RepID=A0A4R4ZFW8_9ACTN|nr:O-antigen ligase family protein [Nonomuraea terrae]TDD57275.1 O-antigen ligase domain-containing protein [Nonomuraea terrae]